MAWPSAGTSDTIGTVEPSGWALGLRSNVLVRHLLVLISLFCLSACTIAELPPLPTDTSSQTSSDTAANDANADDTGMAVDAAMVDSGGTDPQDVVADVANPETDLGEVDASSNDTMIDDGLAADGAIEDASESDSGGSVDSSTEDDATIADDVIAEDTADVAAPDTEDSDVISTDV